MRTHEPKGWGIDSIRRRQQVRRQEDLREARRSYCVGEHRVALGRPMMRRARTLAAAVLGTRASSVCASCGSRSNLCFPEDHERAILCEDCRSPFDTLDLPRYYSYLGGQG